MSSSNTTPLHPGAAFDRDTRPAPSEQVEDHLLPPVIAAPALHGLCSRTSTPAPPSLTADRSTCGETVPPPHWTPPGCWSVPSAIPGQSTIGAANLHLAEANPPQSPLKTGPK